MVSTFGSVDQSALGVLVQSALGVKGILDTSEPIAGQDDLFVAGVFTNWEGSLSASVVSHDIVSETWVDADDSLALPTNVRSFAILEGVLYCGVRGAFDDFAVWQWDTNGQDWVTVGSGDDALKGRCEKIGVHDGKLVAIGSTDFTTVNAGTLSQVVQFDDPGWSGIGNYPDSGHDLYDLLSDGSDLYVVGEDSGDSTLKRIALSKWNGTSWAEVEGRPRRLAGGFPFAKAYAIEKFSSVFYIGGSNFAGVNGTSSNNDTILCSTVVSWDGTDSGFSETGGSYAGLGMSYYGPDLKTADPVVYTIKTVNNRLYCGGKFQLADQTFLEGEDTDNWIGGICEIVPTNGNGERFVELNGGVQLEGAPNEVTTVYEIIEYDGKVIVGCDQANSAGHPTPDVTSVNNFYQWDPGAAEWSAYKSSSGTNAANQEIRAIIDATNIFLAPNVTITSPSDSSVFTDQDSISFAATVIDEDGDISASLSWSSDIDGVIGSGAAFSNSLTVASHTITASVTDSDSLEGTDEINITVNKFLTITGVSPSSGDEAGGETVNITGTGFTGSTTVNFDGNAATNVTFNSSTSIDCDTPAGSGTVDVQVVDGSDSDTKSNAYTYSGGGGGPR